MTTEERAVKVMEEARAGLLASHPFLGYLCFKLKWRPDSTCPTAWTDGIEVGFNPEFVLKLTKGQRKFLVAHEVGHPMLGHHLRRGDKDPRKWNIACDYVLNLLLVDQRFQRMDDMLLDYAFTGMAVEEAYKKLFGDDQDQNPSKSPQDRSGGQGESKGQDGQDQGTGDGSGDQSQKKGGGKDAGGQPSEGSDKGDSGGSGQDQQAGNQDTASGGQGGTGGQEDQGTTDPGGCGEVRDFPGDNGTPTPEEVEIEAEKWDIAVQQAAQIARKIQGEGSLPGWVETILTDISDPKLTGEEVIARWIDQRAKDDYSYTRPNKRYISSGIYFPGLHSEDLGEVAVFWDTSGSVDDSQAADIAGFTMAVLDNYPGVTVRLYHIDTQVRHRETLTADTDWSKISAKGGGGTDFRPGFVEIAEDPEVDVVGVIYLTDGDCSKFPVEEPLVPVLWVLVDMPRYKRFNPPFGEVAYL